MAITQMKFEDIMVKWNKPDIQGQILCDSTYVSYLKYSNL